MKNNLFRSVLIGSAISGCLTLMILAIAAYLVVEESIDFSTLLIIAPIVCGLSVFAGGIIAYQIMKEKALICCLMVAGIYLFLQIISAVLVYESDFANLFSEIITVIASAAAACFICTRSKGRGASAKNQI